MHLVNNLNSFKMRKSSLAKGWIYLSGNFFTSKTLHKSLQHNNIHMLRCFRYFKDTKLRANHNYLGLKKETNFDVSDISKILN